MSAVYPFDLPVILGTQGPQPTPPATINAQIIAAATAASPGLTANLPGILIEDVSSTDTAGVVICDQARVETINSLTPLGANQFTLGQLGQIYIGQTQPGQPSNTSVPVIFAGTVGYVIPNGFLVGDGANSYQIQTGGVITSTGFSSALTALAVFPGTFGVPVGTVTTILSSVPTNVQLTVNNTAAGTPGGIVESYASFRARVLQAGLAACVGSARFIKTMLGLVSGVTSNLISVQQASGGLRVIATGGDVYSIAYAIYIGVGNPADLVGSAVSSTRNVTVSLIDSPDTYPITYVNTPQQTVTMTVTWNTQLSNFTGGSAFPSLTQQPLANYINSLAPGQVINELEMNSIFQQAISGVLNPTLLTRLVFAVYINGTLTPAGTGTYAVTGDPESNFYAVTSGITVLQG